MVGLPDLLKILEMWPAWKRLVATPDKVAALEERLAALEARLAGPAVAGDCPKCGAGTLRFNREEGDPVFGVVGVTRIYSRCDTPGCGYERFQQQDNQGTLGRP